MIPSALPCRAGVGFKPEHFAAIIAGPQPIGFFEVHAENYMGAGGPPHAQLGRLREDFSLSIHGVGLSIGSMQSLDRTHLARLRTLCDRYQPESFSEHLAWSSHDSVFLNDLLPLPYTEETLDRVVEHIDQVQEALGRQMLLENPATYLLFEESAIEETAFLAEIARRTGCGLLLDVNNVHVSAHNLGFDAWAFIEQLPVEAIGEIHLAGHAINRVGDDTILIDDHGSRVPPEVWTLYARALSRIGAKPTLIEWDTAVPALDVLLGEAMWADLLARATAYSEYRSDRIVGVSSETSMGTTPRHMTDKGLRMPALAACSAVRKTPVRRNHHEHA